MLKNKFIKNLSWIFVGNLVHAVLQFLLNVFVARVYTTENYGLINYSSSLIAFFSSVGTLGFTGIITKYFAADEKNTGEYLGTAITARMVFSIFAIIVLQIIVRTTSQNEPELALIVFCQSLSIFFSSFDLLVYWFRYKGEAKVVAVLRLLAFSISASWRLVVIYFKKDISFYVLGVTVETIFFVLFLCITYLKQYSSYQFHFSMQKLKVMLGISYPFVFSAILSTIYGQTDKIMLKAMVDNTAVAMYSVSLTLAGLIVIIPTALLEGFRPEILSYKISNEAMYRKRLKQLYALVFWICTMYCMFISIFAKWIILILYGEKYLGAVPALALVVWYTSFSYFGAINNLYMVAEGKTKWVQITTLFGALLNIILNYLFIPKFGINGAACASLITQIMANFVLLYFIPDLKDNFKIIVQAICLHGIFDKKLGGN